MEHTEPQNKSNNDNNNEILIKREPVVYTRARRAVQKKKKKKKRRKKKEARTVQYNSKPTFQMRKFMIQRQQIASVSVPDRQQVLPESAFLLSTAGKCTPRRPTIIELVMSHNVSFD